MIRLCHMKYDKHMYDYYYDDQENKIYEYHRPPQNDSLDYKKIGWLSGPVASFLTIVLGSIEESMTIDSYMIILIGSLIGIFIINHQFYRYHDNIQNNNVGKIVSDEQLLRYFRRGRRTFLVSLVLMLICILFCIISLLMIGSGAAIRGILIYLVSLYGIIALWNYYQPLGYVFAYIKINRRREK